MPNLVERARRPLTQRFSGVDFRLAAQPWQMAFYRLGIAISSSEESQLGASNETRRCRIDDGCDDLLCSAALDNCSRCRTLVVIRLLSAN